MARVWRADVGTDQEPEAALEAMEAITCLAAGVSRALLSGVRCWMWTDDCVQRDCWLTGSVDAEVRQYEKGKTELAGHVTSAIGVPIRAVAVDPKGSRVAVASECVVAFSRAVAPVTHLLSARLRSKLLTWKTQPR